MGAHTVDIQTNGINIAYVSGGEVAMQGASVMMGMIAVGCLSLGCLTEKTPPPPCVDLDCERWPTGFTWESHKEVSLSVAFTDANGIGLAELPVHIYESYETEKGGFNLLFSGVTNTLGVIDLQHRVAKVQSEVWVNVLDGRPNPWFPLSAGTPLEVQR